MVDPNRLDAGIADVRDDVMPAVGTTELTRQGDQASPPGRRGCF
jgi:hypothetical protein